MSLEEHGFEELPDGTIRNIPLKDWEFGKQHMASEIDKITRKIKVKKLEEKKGISLGKPKRLDRWLK